MRNTVFSERYCDHFTLLSETLIIPSESHMASRPFQPGFALIPSNPHSIPVLLLFFTFGPKHTECVEPCVQFVFSGIPYSLPCTTKIPNHPTLEILGLREKKERYKLCYFDMQKLNRERGSEV